MTAVSGRQRKTRRSITAASSAAEKKCVRASRSRVSRWSPCEPQGLKWLVKQQEDNRRRNLLKQVREWEDAVLIQGGWRSVYRDLAKKHGIVLRREDAVTREAIRAFVRRRFASRVAAARLYRVAAGSPRQQAAGAAAEEPTEGEAAPGASEDATESGANLGAIEHAAGGLDVHNLATLKELRRCVYNGASIRGTIKGACWPCWAL